MLREWPTAIEDVTATFQNQQLPNLSSNTQIWIMMEVLCGIPEEVLSNLKIIENFKRQFTTNDYN